MTVPALIPRTAWRLFLTKGYSTKGENRGVGLFLARSANPESGRRYLTVESEPGVFTQFFVQIPWDSERNMRVINVLIVDDDAMVADLNRLYVNTR